ncbi:hypothetical protein M5K25_027209 [Dendrobium thyrsiflorum]|uniref:Uncharacterized protein n=1 Tax=Dendrobium thyrsiflorum TaxID=117978 RepID=A0ABD0TZR9_DENTH
MCEGGRAFVRAFLPTQKQNRAPGGVVRSFSACMPGKSRTLGSVVFCVPTRDQEHGALIAEPATSLLCTSVQMSPIDLMLDDGVKDIRNKLDLLGHLDMDVKVSIAYCLRKITRITTPDAPYDDDIMNEIFGLIVGAFKNLDEMSSNSYPKRVSILEIVAKVESYILMLDLYCDDLILEMFKHFLKTIRSKHSDTVFSSMETIMTLVLKETESISAQLLSCLLDDVKVVEKNILQQPRC